jgi:hypothetical protein
MCVLHSLLFFGGLLFVVQIGRPCEFLGSVDERIVRVLFDETLCRGDCLVCAARLGQGFDPKEARFCGELPKAEVQTKAIYLR